MVGPCPPLVLVLAAPLNSVNSVAGLCGWALSSSCSPFGRAPELCQLCGRALWLALSSSCPPLVNSVNSVAGLCGWALSSSCPPFGRVPELCQLCGWALWLGLVLLLAAPLNSVNVWLGSVAGPCPTLSTLWLGLTLSTLWLGSVAGPCPPLVLLLAVPLSSVNSVAGLCGWALSSSCPCLGLCQLCG